MGRGDREREGMGERREERGTEREWVRGERGREGKRGGGKQGREEQEGQQMKEKGFKLI